MKTNRLEAFSDGVLAIIITIMVLELKLFQHRIAWAIYVIVAIMWLVPDKRIERVLGD